MNERELDLIQDCMEDLYLSRQEFPRRFYERLFQLAPETEAMFTNDPSRQNLLLYAVMTMVVRCMRTGRNPRDELKQFGGRHARAGVREEMFPIFGQAFLETMVEFLPHRDCVALADAWSHTYEAISAAIIEGMHETQAPVRLFRRTPDQSVARVAFGG